MAVPKARHWAMLGSQKAQEEVQVELNDLRGDGVLRNLFQSACGMPTVAHASNTLRARPRRLGGGAEISMMGFTGTSERKRSSANQ